MCYAEDVLLIGPTRTAMQRMLFEMESIIVFSTDPTPSKSKSKCIYVQYVVGSKNLCGHVLPFVAQADHLGSIITERGNMEQDA